MRHALQAGIGAVLVSIGALAPCAAKEIPYLLTIPEGSSISFRIDFAVEHPGTVVIDAEWDGGRVLTFRLRPPGGAAQRLRRSGPSPQQLRFDVAAREVDPDRPWRLTIRPAPGRTPGSGSLTIRVPDAEPPPEPDPPQDGGASSPEVGERRPLLLESWQEERQAPLSASNQQRRVFEVVERFRAQVVDEGGRRPDPCRWNDDLLRYLADWRDQLADSGSIPPVESRRYMRRVLESIRTVDGMRDPNDPILAGPVPADSGRRRAWEAVRRRRVSEIERELDALVDLVRGGHAPELERHDWPVRLLSCVAACERHFDERLLVGRERAGNAELAVEQWPVVLAAADAFEVLAFLSAPE